MDTCFILRCIRQCFSSPASCLCLMLPQITVWRKGTPCPTTASKPRGQTRRLLRAWICWRAEKLLYYSGCWAVFWGSHLITPLFSPLLARCQVSAGARGRVQVTAFGNLGVGLGSGGRSWDEPLRELCVRAYIPLSVHVPLVFSLLLLNKQEHYVFFANSWLCKSC